MLIIAICAGLMAVFLAIALFTSGSSSQAEKRLQRLVGSKGDKKEGGDAASAKAASESALYDDEDPSLWSTLLGFAARITAPGSKEGDEGVYSSVRQDLIESGFRGPSALSIYMGSRVVLAFGLAALTVVLSWTIGRPPKFAVIAVAAMIGYVVPGIILSRLKAARQLAVQRGLADAIDLMVVCTEAGLGLGATLSRVSKEFEDTEPVIAEEFRTTVAETQAGRGLMKALHSMAARTGCPELGTLVSLLIQTERFGTPMSDTLRGQAESMRFERMQRAEEAAQRAPVRMMLPASFIFLAILLILGAPAVIQILGALPE